MTVSFQFSRADILYLFRNKNFVLGYSNDLWKHELGNEGGGRNRVGVSNDEVCGVISSIKF